MEAYSGFAYVYDLLMQDVDYKGWVSYIEQIFERNKIKPQNIAELACGTGNVTNLLAERGYNMIGTDLSEDMLSVAQEKAMELENTVIYLNQDMREMMLPSELDCILCVCDGVNYIVHDHELQQIFQSVYEHLKEEGLFIFDISSYYKLSHILGTNTFAENHKRVSYIWENYFDEQQKICDFDLTLFVQEGKLYRKYIESHRQRAYKEEEILNLLKKASFKQIEVYEAFSFNAPKEESERIYFVCRR